MGFSAIPPRNSQAATDSNLAMWTARADIAIMHISPPYRALLTGTTASAYVNAVDLPLANYYHAKGLPIVITLDITNGLDRSKEHPDLVAMGRSITEPEVQLVYRNYALALATTVRPEYLGLAAETNLIREVAPASIYNAVVTMANDAANRVGSLSSVQIRPYVSVQVDVAWGKLINTPYKGIERDFTDFPFVQAVGLSTYPYFAFPNPEDVPLDYFSRLKNGRTIPVMVVEGGWTSASVGTVQSDAAKQVRWLRRQERILDSAKAIGVMQLTFADFDLSLFGPQPPGSTLPLFAQIGFVDVNLRPKVALSTYDSIFARPRSP